MLFFLLTSAGLLALSSQGLPREEPVSSLHLRFDARTWTLAWNCVGNITVLQCTMDHKDKGPVIKEPGYGQCNCIFEDYVLHRGVLFTVNASFGHRYFQETLEYRNPGVEGTAAENFSCFVLDEEVMNCSWTKGRAAPDRVQYFFYTQDSDGGPENECPHYIEDEGTHVGCYVRDISALPFNIYFLVNGTSPESDIQFFDYISPLPKMQRYTPPVNIQVTCNQSHCLLTWERPKAQQNMSPREQCYEIDIQQKGKKDRGNEALVKVGGDAENKFLVPINPRARYTVRIRTSNSRVLHWGPWSELKEFGSEEQEASPIYIYVLVVLGTLLGALVVVVLCKRFLLMNRLFPPIPKIKNKFSDGQQMNWEDPPPGTEKISRKEEVISLEEVTELKLA